MQFKSKKVQLTKHIYSDDTIGSMIGIGTLNDPLTCNSADTKGNTKVLVVPLYREPVCFTEL